MEPEKPEAEPLSPNPTPVSLSGDEGVISISQLEPEAFESGPFLNLWSREIVVFPDYESRLALPNKYGGVVVFIFERVSALQDIPLGLRLSAQNDEISVLIRWGVATQPYHAWANPLSVFYDPQIRISFWVEIVEGDRTSIARIRVDLWEVEDE